MQLMLKISFFSFSDFLSFLQYMDICIALLKLQSVGKAYPTTYLDEDVLHKLNYFQRQLEVGLQCWHCNMFGVRSVVNGVL